MKGVLFNVAEEAVTDLFGEEMWDLLLADAGLDGVYTSLGDYPAEQLVALVGAARARTGLSVDEVLRSLGRAGFSGLVGRSPELVEPYYGVVELASALDAIIHPEVLKLYPAAVTPRFSVRSVGAGRIELDYESDRGLCVLAEGLLLGAADHYGQPATVSQAACRHRGDPTCTLVVNVGA
jgi:hypothetical protein